MIWCIGVIHIDGIVPVGILHSNNTNNTPRIDEQTRHCVDLAVTATSLANFLSIVVL